MTTKAKTKAKQSVGLAAGGVGWATPGRFTDVARVKATTADILSDARSLRARVGKANKAMAAQVSSMLEESRREREAQAQALRRRHQNSRREMRQELKRDLGQFVGQLRTGVSQFLVASETSRTGRPRRASLGSLARRCRPLRHRRSNRPAARRRAKPAGKKR